MRVFWFFKLIYYLCKKLNMKIKDRTGEKYLTNQGYLATVINYKNQLDCDIEFESGVILYNISFKQVKKGTIKNPYHPTIYNIGYHGIGKYKSRIEGVKSKEYNAWTGMFTRCYNLKFQKKHLTYRNIIVCREWHNFQNFAKWYKENWKPWMEGWHLDKDILVKGNKIYSPETCAFVPSEINSLFLKANTIRGKYPIGVSFNRKENMYTSSIRGYTRTFNTIEKAFEYYKTAKEQHIKEVADKWRDKIDKRVYNIMINYKVELSD